MSPPTATAFATELDQLAINTLRFLAVDMVEQASSGHPGAPMGQAPLAYWLWTRHLRHNPADPGWIDRDRFVLSCGHASALLYGLLHLAGYPLPLDELRRFRQLGSRTPGHPEHGHTIGVETTTGPLGQGVGNAVGMAMAERILAARFNRDGFPVIDHRTWVIASDGDMMEGVASEACSLAGHLGLGKLTVFYDANGISIDGPTTLAFSEDVGGRFAAYGWHVVTVEDGNDLAAIDAAVHAAVDDDRPSLVVVRTHIGYGSPGKQDSAEAHGAPLGAAEVAAAKRNLGWPEEPTFLVPEEVRRPFRENAERGAALEREWDELVERWAAAHPDAAAELRARAAGELPAGWHEALPRFAAGSKPLATRQASGKVINALAPVLPQLLGGSADLAGSNSTLVDGEGDFSALVHGGRNLRFGVREHGMGSILNGMALSRLLIPFGGTFLIFSDYMKPPIRLAALMGLQVIYVFTHDSIFLGEDGPTHQPIGQLAGLRATPNLRVVRPADANETAAAWRMAIEHTAGPTALALTRQKLPILPGTEEGAYEGVSQGAYVLADPDDGRSDLVLIATGSEVALAMEARELLAGRGVAARVVSMPCQEVFAAQPAAVRDRVLPPDLPRRLAIEAASPFGWRRWVGDRGDVHALDGFGASAPAGDLARHFGFTPEAVADHAQRLLAD